jgi:hypothetical protein
MHSSLTPAQAERLEMLAEEACEVAQTCMKILRHGYASYHPNDKEQTPNRDLLRNEVHDLLCVLWVMSFRGDIDFPNTGGMWLDERWRSKKLRWTHHQSDRHRYLSNTPTITHYVHFNGSAYFVKEAEYFIDQGGLIDPWGKAWKPVTAVSVEEARQLAVGLDWS